MRWLADECVAADLVDRLRAAGHNVTYIAERHAGLRDADVLGLAHREGRLLLTEDKDFGELVFRSGMPVPGVVLLRIDPEKGGLRWPRLEVAILEYGERLTARYLVVEERRIRSRPLLKTV